MLSEQIIIFIQIVLIDLVLAGDNAIIIGMVASQFPPEQRKKLFFGDKWSSSFKNNTNFVDCLSITNSRN